MKLTKRERDLIALLETTTGDVIDEVERLTDDEFDLRIKGVRKSHGGVFSGLLIRAAIYDLVEWTSRQVARMTDYPEMAEYGDWSGVRDSSDEKLRAIFDAFVLPKL